MRAVAVVKDLFFVARIKETARMVGTPLVFARTPEDLKSSLAEPTDLVIIDLTTNGGDLTTNGGDLTTNGGDLTTSGGDLTTNGWDYEAFFAVLQSVRPPVAVLGYTTHALARATEPLHGRCTRVVTKETLTQELPELLRSGVVA